MKPASKKQKLSLILFGTLLGFFLVEITLILLAGAMGHLQEKRNFQSIKQNGTYTILCLGESDSTIGGENSYPRHLERILNAEYPHTKFTVINKGFFGINTTDILASLDDNLKKYKPDMVISMMGFNTKISSSERGSAKYSLSELIDFTFRHLKTFSLMKSLKTNIFNRLHNSPSTTPYTTNTFESDPDITSPTILLAYQYIDSNNYEKAINLLENEIRIDPENAEIYTELSLIYAFLGNDLKSDQMIAKAININPEHHEAHIQLGEHYCHFKNNKEKGIESFNKMLSFDPNNIEARVSLSACLVSQNKYEEARLILEPIRHVKNDRLLGILGVLNLMDSTGGKSKNYFHQLTRLNTRYFNQRNRQNFNAIKNRITSKRITYVSVQYPLWNIKSLKMMYDNPENIIFISNEKVFKKAVSADGYNHYFSDMYAGSFGHPTDNGRKLLAQNIANNLIETVFK